MIMKLLRILWLCSMAALALCAFGTSTASAKPAWVVEGKVLAAGMPPTHGKAIETKGAEPVRFEVAALHEVIQCKKAELVGSSGTGHAYIWNEEPSPNEFVGRQEGLIKFSQCENLNKPSCTVAAATLNTGHISGTLTTENGTPKKIYDMLVGEKWEEIKPATFAPFAEITQTAPCASAVVSANGFAGEIYGESGETTVHTFKFLGKPACSIAPIGEIVLWDTTLDKISMRIGVIPAEACVFFDVVLVSGEKWSVK
jgi:hypothetical protein